MILKDFLTLWLETYIEPNRAPKTGEAYKYALAHLGETTLQTELDELTPIQIQREVNRLSAIYSRQAQLMYIAIRAALKKAVALGMMTSRPMENVEAPKHEKKEISYFTPAEASAYLREAEKVKDGSVLILMLCLGLRRNEARGLRYGDLGEDGVLRLKMQRTKDGMKPLKTKASRREIPVPEALRTLFDGPAGEYLTEVTEKTLQVRHLAVMKAAGIRKNVTLHGLRHTCATSAIKNGVQLVTIQRLLGHARFNVTADTYIHTDRRSLELCATQIIGAFNYQHMEKFTRLEIV